MPYILAFWRERDGAASDPNQVYDAICDGNPVEQLVELPIDEIKRAFRDAFDPVLPRSDDYAWEAADGGDMFLLETGPYHRFVVAGHNTNTDHYNTAVDIMKRYQCPLYDPQTETRYAL